MKKICIVLFALSLGFLILTQPSSADKILLPGDSLWASAPAPSSFDGMSFYWGAKWRSNPDADLDYILYGPTGWSGTPKPAKMEAPSVVDLSIFQGGGKNVVFQFYNKPTSISMSLTSMFGLDDFKYEFFDDATPLWSARGAPIQTTIGEFSAIVPLKGDKFFIHNLTGVIDGTYDPSIGPIDKNVAIRSDFQAAPVPEPATLLLLASGIVALAGGRRKFSKK